MHTAISSLHNPHVKEACHLRERHYRNKLGLFLIEGYRELQRASKHSAPIDKLFICPELFLGENEDALIEAIEKQGAKIIPCTETVFRKMSYRDRPDGLLAIAPYMPRGLNFLDTKLQGVKNPLLIIAEAIEKPGNLGTILRTADASGCQGVIVCNRCTDITNPNVVRASTGTLFCLPIVEATSEETFDWLETNKIASIAARPQATKNYTDANMKGPCAIVVGCEQLGLSSIWQKRATEDVKIPMLGEADSLNVAQATTILLYEAVRQRT